MSTQDQRGYTLVELIMAAAVIGILALVVSDFYTGRLVDYARNFTQLILQSNTKQAVETMERAVKSAQVVEADNRHPDSNSPGAPGNPNSWHSTTGNSPADTLVLAIPTLNTSNEPMYVDDLQNTLHTNDVVFYYNATDQALYRRVVANPVSGNQAVTTCPPALATPACPADAKIVEDVASLRLKYYRTDGAETAVPSEAKSVEITLQQSRERFGRTYTSKLTTRITMRNG